MVNYYSVKYISYTSMFSNRLPIILPWTKSVWNFDAASAEKNDSKNTNICSLQCSKAETVCNFMLRKPRWLLNLKILLFGFHLRAGMFAKESLEVLKSLELLNPSHRVTTSIYIFLTIMSAIFMKNINNLFNQKSLYPIKSEITWMLHMLCCWYDKSAYDYYVTNDVHTSYKCFHFLNLSYTSSQHSHFSFKWGTASMNLRIHAWIPGLMKHWESMLWKKKCNNNFE